MDFIAYGKQSIAASDIDAVVQTLKSDWLTQGPVVEKFEKALAQFCDARYAVAVSSGTAALHLACLTAGLTQNDEAVTSALSFAATANAVIYAGACPVFADIDPSNGNIDAFSIETRLTKKTKAILPVHFGGLPCDMATIDIIARKRRLMVIEDASHALGAKYKIGNRWFRVGSCAHSDMTIFSFHPVKHLTTGEGGLITTNKQILYEKLKALRTHGISKDKKTARIGPWYYEMRDLGFNYRITDIQCALGLSQLKHLNAFIQRRRQIADHYHNVFAGLTTVKTIREDPNFFNAHHLFVLLINFAKLHTDRKQFMNTLSQQGVGSQVHYIPIYRHPYYRKNFPVRIKDYPHTEDFYRQCLSIPMYPALTDAQIKKITKTLLTMVSPCEKT